MTSFKLTQEEIEYVILGKVPDSFWQKYDNNKIDDQPFTRIKGSENYNDQYLSETNYFDPDKFLSISKPTPKNSYLPQSGFYGAIAENIEQNAILNAYTMLQEVETDEEFDIDDLNELKDKIRDDFKKSLMDSEYPLGATVTPSLAQALMQMTLNSFHQAGKGSSAGTGFDRMQELINASPKPKNVTSRLKYDNPELSAEDIYWSEVSSLVEVYLSDIIDSYQLYNLSQVAGWYFDQVPLNYDMYNDINYGWVERDLFPPNNYLTDKDGNYLKDDQGNYRLNDRCIVRAYINKMKMYHHGLTMKDIEEAALSDNNLGNPNIVIIPSTFAEGYIDFVPTSKVFNDERIEDISKLTHLDISKRYIDLFLISMLESKESREPAPIKGIMGIKGIYPTEIPFTRVLRSVERINIDEINRYLFNYNPGNIENNYLWKLYIEQTFIRRSPYTPELVKNILNHYGYEIVYWHPSDIFIIVIEHEYSIRQYPIIDLYNYFPNNFSYPVTRRIIHSQKFMNLEYRSFSDRHTDNQGNTKIKDPKTFIDGIINYYRDEMDNQVRALTNTYNKQSGAENNKSLEGGDVPENNDEEVEDLQSGTSTNRDSLSTGLIVPSREYRFLNVLWPETRGSDLLHVFLRDYINPDLCKTDDIHETKRLFGINAARNVIIEEFDRVISNIQEVDPRNLTVAADTIVNRGVLQGFKKKAIEKSRSPGLGPATYGEPLKHIYNAGMEVSRESAESSVVAVATGTKPGVGTGSRNFEIRKDVGKDISSEVTDDNTDIHEGNGSTYVSYEEIPDDKVSVINDVRSQLGLGDGDTQYNYEEPPSTKVVTEEDFNTEQEEDNTIFDILED